MHDFVSLIVLYMLYFLTLIHRIADSKHISQLIKMNMKIAERYITFSSETRSLNILLQRIIHSFTYFCVRSFVSSFVCSFVRSFVGSFVRWFVRWLVRSLVRWLVGSFVQSFVRSFVCSFV